MIARPSLGIRSESTGTALVVAVTGEIDVASVGTFRDHVTEALRKQPGVLVVDLSAVSFLDSAGVAQLWRMHCDSTTTEVRLVVNSEPARRVLQLAGFDQLMTLYTDPSQALADF